MTAHQIRGSPRISRPGKEGGVIGSPETNDKDLVVVPHDSLEPETLNAVIEAFILREGTNYGANEVSLDTQIEQVRRQLQNRSIKLVFDEESESCSLITEKQFKERKRIPAQPASKSE